MHIVQLSEISKSYGTQDVLEDIHWQIPDGARVALVGRNGTGKTTLFRILTGELQPDRGKVWMRRGTVVAAVEQEVEIEDRRTLRDEAARGFQHVQDLHDELDELGKQLGSLKEGDPESESVLERYAFLQERVEHEGGFSFEVRVKEVLTGLHFSEKDLDRPLAEFSGGQKSRAILARVLLRDPDLLLLDEPTNHLDLAAIEWLEAFLLKYSGAFVLVSHDRMFVNRVARQVAELRHRKLHHFQGNYDKFLVERERRLEEQSKRYEMQQDEIRRTEDFIRKNIVGQKTKQAQSRRKMLEKIERLDAPEWPASSIHMRLPEAERLPRVVVEGKGLTQAYGDLKVFSNVSFQLLRGQKMGLIGPNGVGKTTLLKLVVGQASQDEGVLRIGPGVEMGYFEQEQAELRGSQSVLDEVWKVTPQVSEQEMRTFLGGFLFRGEDVFKSLSQLSGGEKSRVALAKLVREGSNLLVLDEPTNHLDIESREVFEAAMRAYTGCVLVVSHDRYFLDRVVDHVLELKPDGAQVWEGTYSDFSRRKHDAAAPELTRAKPSSPPPKPAANRKQAEEDKDSRVQSYEDQKRRKRDEEKLRRRLQDAEARVEALENEKESLALAMEDPALATDHDRLGELSAAMEKANQDLGEAISEWERLSLRLEAFLDGPK